VQDLTRTLDVDRDESQCCTAVSVSGDSSTMFTKALTSVLLCLFVAQLIAANALREREDDEVELNDDEISRTLHCL
jgi:hypothetical protein